MTPDEIEREVEKIVRRAKYEGYLQSPSWRDKRRAKLIEADFKCEECGYGEYEAQDQALDVHHKTYDRFGDEPLSDLVVLCRRCHDKKHPEANRERD